TGSDGGQWADKSEEGFSTGNSLQFDGLNDYVNMGDLSNVDGIASSTFEMWINPTTVGVYNPILTKYASNTGAGGFQIIFGADNKIMFFMSNTSDNRLVATTSLPVVLANEWQHVSVIFDGSKPDYLDKMKIYFNGIEESLDFSAATAFTTIPATNKPLRVGTITFGSGSMAYGNGEFDDIRMYNRVLSADEIKAHYERRKYAVIEPTATDGTESLLGEIEVQIPHWQENDNKVWVKIPSVPASGSVDINMYYGNASVESSGDSDLVFDFYDGFDGVSIDTSKWGGDGLPYASVSNGVVTLDPDLDYRELTTYKKVVPPLVFETYWYSSGWVALYSLTNQEA
ncbi:MAG: DUF2341 domain-containing protein, partial [Candidatus Diapherotrites archaeon]|nr:DUF2341 domain-containing protein [Candidatus Diapherotrites archaeon]